MPANILPVDTPNNIRNSAQFAPGRIEPVKNKALIIPRRSIAGSRDLLRASMRIES